LAIPSQNKKSCKATHKPTRFCSTFYFALPHPYLPTIFSTTDNIFPYICPVKQVLTLIFSFYVLALSCMPCSDKDDSNYMSADQSTFATTDHSDHDNDTENCSPFCMCACCGQSFSSPFSHYSLSLHVPVSLEKFPVYNASFVSEVYLSIWQPPKIS
jgi:hypothetical protein